MKCIFKSYEFFVKEIFSLQIETSVAKKIYIWEIQISII